MKGKSLTNPQPQGQVGTASSKSAAARSQSAADWQRPPGLTSAKWEYVRSGRIAEQYNQFLDGDPLTSLDGQIVAHYLPGPSADQKPPHVLDLGCGTGRTLWPIAERGYRCLGVDLSLPMLRELGRDPRGLETEQSIDRVQANLVQLEGLADHAFDVALCLFSTLGMIEGRVARDRFLRHVHRVLKPGGRFLVHAHNVAYQWRLPGGVRWSAGNAWAACRGIEELGDRRATYRGLPNFFIHSFRRSELNAALHGAGLRPRQWWGVTPGASQPRPEDPLPKLSWRSDWQLVGWIVDCYCEPESAFD